MASSPTSVMRAIVAGTALAAALCLASAPAAGQADASARTAALAADLSQALRAQVRQALERQLKPDEFQVFVTATPAQKADQPMPYLPETLSQMPPEGAPPEALAPLLARVKVEVLIADTYDQAARAKLDTIIRKTLALDAKRGDTVTFASLGLKVDRPESAAQMDMLRAENEARDLRTRLDALGRERDDAKRDLTQARGELDRVSREKSQIERDRALDKEQHAQDQGKDRRGAEDQTKQPPADRGFWRENAVLLVGALLIILALLGLGVAVRAAASVLGTAVETIGAGIPTLGEKLGESLAQKPLALPPAGSPAAGLGPTPALAPAAASSAALIPIDMVAKRVLELHEELAASIDVAGEGQVLEYLAYLLDDPATIGTAVAAMELLGKDRANALYAKLRRDHQNSVWAFLKSGSHGRPKGEVMIEAGEALKTRLFGAAIPRSATLSDAVAERLLLLSTGSLVDAARALSGSHLARFFLYLDPPRLGAVLTSLRAVDQAAFDKAATAIVKIPEVENAEGLDADVAAVVDAQVARADSDIQGPYLAYYKALVDSVEDEVAESLAELLAASNPRVDRFVREAVITFGTFFKLHGEVQEEIVNGLSNKDLAATIASLRDDLKAVFLGHVDARRRELVEEEVGRLVARGARAVTGAHRAGKRQVVARIQEMKAGGSLADLLAPRREGLPPLTPGVAA